MDKESHMTATVEPTVLQTLPPIQCQPWCVEGEHEDDVDPEDQTCVTAYLMVDLSIEQPVIYCLIGERLSPLRQRPTQLGVYASQAATDDAGVRIFVEPVNHLPFELTPQEAQELVENLRLTLAEIGA